MKSLVSIVIAVHNGELFLKECLESILAQTYPHIEIIVVDDGSTDHTSDVLKAFEHRITWVWQPASGGPCSPRNRGAAMARGEYIGFFDADDVMRPTKIERQVHLLESTLAGFVVSNYVDWQSPEKPEQQPDHFSECTQLRRLLGHKTGMTMDSDALTYLLLQENFSITGAVLYRRSAYLKTGGWDTALTTCTDFHLLYRVAMHNSAAIDSTVCFYRRLHPECISGNKERMLLNYIKSRRNLLQREYRLPHKALLRHRISAYMLALGEHYNDQHHMGKALKWLYEGWRVSGLKQIKSQLKLLMKIGVKSLINIIRRKGANDGQG
jgi:glycosyltransferase involved in cell wall biosynthesis